jgi:hypothetical protein
VDALCRGGKPPRGRRIALEIDYTVISASTGHVLRRFLGPEASFPRHSQGTEIIFGGRICTNTLPFQFPLFNLCLDQQITKLNLVSTRLLPQPPDFLIFLLFLFPRFLL